MNLDTFAILHANVEGELFGVIRDTVSSGVRGYVIDDLWNPTYGSIKIHVMNVIYYHSFDNIPQLHLHIKNE